MDDLKNILVFVATIAFFIFSAIRKSKKKTASKGGNISESIESMFGLQTEHIQPSNQFEAPANLIDVKNDEISNKEIIIKEEVNKMPNEIKQTQITDTIENKPVFDLKEAVIYSEILKRKEF